VARRFDRLGWAMDQSDLTPAQRFVLLILADMADEYGLCWPSKSTIAERTGYNLSTVKRTMRELSAEQVLVTEPHWMSNGKQTSNSVRLCLGGRGVTVTPPEDDTDDDGSNGSRGVTTTPRGGHTDPDVEPPTRTSRKNNSQTSSGSCSSRRASRARDDSGWDDPAAEVFAKEQEPDDSEPGSRPRTARNHGPDTAWALNGYYRQAVFVAGTGRVGNTNDGAMRKFFAEARRCGVRPATLRAMVDCFVDDPQLFNRARTHRWKVFIANAPLLQERADNIIGVAPMEEGKEHFGGAIPKAVLDEILAEAG
jgi:hypothetical protein